jgi:LAO/AO transport system kinase
MNTATAANGHGGKLVDAVLRGERAAIARGITLVERDDAAAGSLLRGLRPHLGRAHRVGITGPPGAGKSTLLCGLAALLARQDSTVGVLAVDPSSPFTRGAVLGDRVRMAELDGSDSIFIRSMASRGLGGGLSPRAADAADVLDAAGYDWVLVESVGVGQVDLDIRHVVDTTLVVLVPESGDLVQAIKAGLMEIADLYVVNKCDRDGAGVMLATVQSSVALQHHPDPHWMPRVLGAAAQAGTGIDDVLAELGRHRAHLGGDGRLAARRRAGMRARLTGMLERELAVRVRTAIGDGAIDEAVERALAGPGSLSEIVDALLARWVGGSGATP